MRASTPEKPPIRRTLLSVCCGQNRWKALGGPAQPSPTIAQCLNGGYGWLEEMCKRCEIRASFPLDAVHRPAQHTDREA